MTYGRCEIRRTISELLPDGVEAVEALGDLRNAELLLEETTALGQVSCGRRREFAIARTCARRALAKLGAPPVPILSGQHREPLWPAGIVGSITHCSGYCSAAVAAQSQFASIGIDAEVHDRLPAGVMEVIACKAEYRQLSDLADDGVYWDRVLFSAKESIFKAWFPLTHAWLDFKDVEVTINREAETFSSLVLAPIPVASAIDRTTFRGRFLVSAGRILTAVVVGPDYS